MLHTATPKSNHRALFDLLTEDSPEDVALLEAILRRWQDEEHDAELLEGANPHSLRALRLLNEVILNVQEIMASTFADIKTQVETASCCQ